MSNSELEDKKLIKALRAELEDANKQIRELKLDLAAKSMENGGHTKEQFWKLVVRHENDLLNFDQEKSQMIKRETELIEQLNTLKAEIEARGDFQYKIPPPDPTLVAQHKYEVLSLSYEKLEQENAKLKKDLDEANTKLEEIDKKVTQEVVDVEVIKEALEIIKNKKKYPL
ncbi:unnamed protein product [Moneuplotes crassus]|uniref:Uncharacterized protein n=1 Tax=Euplotes crassus TaxID=5936 RepID=A0AAD1XUY0_EUPCR|nr:unnamed protein product [Moneuplotes crassus]